MGLDPQKSDPVRSIINLCNLISNLITISLDRNREIS